MEERPLTEAERVAMTELLQEALAAGAWGLSSGLFSAPGGYADTAEILTLARVLARHGAAYASHIRDEADHVFDAVREANRLLAEIETAAPRSAGRRRCLSVRHGHEPAAQPPPSLGHERRHPGHARALARRDVRSRVRDEIARTGLTNFGRIPSWDVVRVAVSPHLPEQAGRTLGDIAQSRAVDPLDAVCDFLVADRGETRILITSMADPDVREITRAPWVIAGSDANALAGSGVTGQGKPHPRSCGTHARLLGSGSPIADCSARASART